MYPFLVLKSSTVTNLYFIPLSLFLCCAWKREYLQGRKKALGNVIFDYIGVSNSLQSLYDILLCLWCG
jgi:hypothetical protein